jgi:hypothetical protein
MVAKILVLPAPSINPFHNYFGGWRGGRNFVHVHDNLSLAGASVSKFSEYGASFPASCAQAFCIKSGKHTVHD